MTRIKDNVQSVLETIRQTAVHAGRAPDDITLIAVSKKKDVSTVRAGIDSGIRHLGENYIQEAVEKITALEKEKVSWHFIGHLQSNKARFAVPLFDLIHSVDSVKLAKEINRQAQKIGKTQKILIQVNIGEEETKAGARADQVIELARQISPFESVSVQGLMCMPPFFTDPEEARPFFRHLARIRDELRSRDIRNISMRHLSMGMSNDFTVAVEEGATLVRVGTAIFGERT